MTATTKVNVLDQLTEGIAQLTGATSALRDDNAIPTGIGRAID